MLHVCTVTMCGQQFYGALLGLLWVETVLYGLYVALFAGSVYMLVYQQPNAFYLSTSIALFVVTTAYIGLELARIVVVPYTLATSYLQDSSITPCFADLDPQQRQNEAILWDLLNCVEEAASTVMSLIADGILIYRCMVLWPHRRWISLPLVALLLATVAASIVGIVYSSQYYLLVHSGTGHASQFDAITSWQVTMEISANSLSLATNIIATVLIASQIWYLARQLEKMLGKVAGLRYRAAMSMIIESGLLLAVSGVIVISTNNSESAYLNTAVTEVSLILTVISLTLLVVRVGMGKGFDSVIETVHEHHSSGPSSQSRSTGIRFAPHRSVATDASYLGTKSTAVHETIFVGAEKDTPTTDDSSGRSGASKEEIEVGVQVV
ncbi:hypothetical protein EVG20_g2830 [Dentipellis fragilis]|uniref:Uncharacterized protein n=1 Tax=Dentipellis fragilis TaxID=205917 RepID=A0A4Y9Z6N0_9AGAM|nr:hypothetical protein EVG20_g2830 [Dentipellis fragilis]